MIQARCGRLYWRVPSLRLAPCAWCPRHVNRWCCVRVHGARGCRRAYVRASGSDGGFRRQCAPPWKSTRRGCASAASPRTPRRSGASQRQDRPQAHHGCPRRLVAPSPACGAHACGERSRAQWPYCAILARQWCTGSNPGGKRAQGPGRCAARRSAVKHSSCGAACRPGAPPGTQQR